MSNICRHGSGVTRHLPPRITKDSVTGAAQIKVAPAVALHPRIGGMPINAVELDHRPLAPPEGINGMGADPHVHLGKRQAVAAAEVEEEVLELASGAGVFRAVKGERAVQLRRAGPADAGHGIDRVEVEEMEEVRLGDGLANSVERSDRREIEEGARDGVTGTPLRITRSMRWAR